MKKNKTFITIIVFICIIGCIIFFHSSQNKQKKSSKTQLNKESIKIPTIIPNASPTSLPPQTKNAFIDSFQRNDIIRESGNMGESADLNWWVNSGAYMYIKDGLAETIQGNLPENDVRRISYFKSNPDETDNGYHPQNIFRLVTKSTWTNYQQEVYYRIEKYWLSKSIHRRVSNGLFLFNHYQSGQTLYYTGIRVDGSVDVKKKLNGTYYDMANKPFINGPKYNRDSNPNLLPLNTWIGLRTDINNIGNKVDVIVYVDMGKTGNWTKVLETMDDGHEYGGASILNEGYAGIRTDFMDVEFSNYKITEL